MQKKNNKKSLALTTQTVRALQDGQLGAAAGAISLQSIVVCSVGSCGRICPV